MNQISYLINRTTRKSNSPLNILLFRTSDEFDCKLASEFYQDRIWILNFPAPKPWDFNNFMPPDNVTFIDDVFNCPEVDFDVTIGKHDYNIVTCLNMMKSNYIPHVSLFLHDPPQANKKRFEEEKKAFGDICAAISGEVAHKWYLNDAIIFENFDFSKLREGILGYINENKFSYR